MKKILVLILLSALAAPARAEQITVAAASDLNHAIKELAASFEKGSGYSVSLSFGASGNLYAQIESGAPYDLFFSADADYPAKLVAAGKIDGASIRTYAIGRLVLWVPASLKLDPEQLKMDLILQPEVKKIAIANPQHAPYGRAAMAALDHFQFAGLVKDKLVLGENVSQAAQFVQSGNAQAGLIPLSLALSPPMKAAGKYWQLPDDSYPDIKQAAGILTSSKHKLAARAFLDFVGSAEGAAILQQYGFGLPAHK